MLALERGRREIAALPTLMKIGGVALALSGLADLVAHLGVGGGIEPVGHVHAFTSDEAAAHFAAFVSMVLIFVGAVVDGIRRARTHRRPMGRGQQGDA
jgi:hypothetical protein